MPPLIIVSSSNTESPSSPLLKKKHVTMRDSEEVTKLHQFESNQNVDSVPSRELASCTTTSLTTLTTGTAGAACDVKTLCGNFFKIDATEKISITKLAILVRRQRHMLKIARLRFIGVKLVDLVRILVVWYDSYCCMTYETINLTKKDFSIYHNSIGNLDSGVNIWNGSIYYSVIPASTVSECCLYHISE